MAIDPTTWPAQLRAGRVWLLVVGSATAAILLLRLLGLPSATLFGALLGGMCCALSLRRPPKPPRRTFLAGQALIGATIGSLVTPATLQNAWNARLPILLVTLSTLLISVLAGRLMAQRGEVSRVTGAFALVAGGASGISGIARSLGADDRVVAVVQYLRVLLVLLAMPVAAAVLDGSSAGHPRPPVQAHSPIWVGLVLVVLALGVGLPLARLLHIPAGPLLGPLLVATVVAGSGFLPDPTVAEPLQQLAYLLIGLQVGLGFTRSSLRSIASLLPTAVGLILAVVLTCAGLGWVLTATTDMAPLDAYLATTPGGLYAVLATAVSSGSNLALILATQVTRVLVMLLAAPVLAQLLSREGQGKRDG